MLCHELLKVVSGSRKLYLRISSNSGFPASFVSWASNSLIVPPLRWPWNNNRTIVKFDRDCMTSMPGSNPVTLWRSLPGSFGAPHFSHQAQAAHAAGLLIRSWLWNRKRRGWSAAETKLFPRPDDFDLSPGLRPRRDDRVWEWAWWNSARTKVKFPCHHYTCAWLLWEASSVIDDAHSYCLRNSTVRAPRISRIEVHQSGQTIFITNQTDFPLTNNSTTRQVQNSVLRLSGLSYRFIQFRNNLWIWHVPSRPPVSPLEERLHENSSPPRQRERARRPPVEWRNLTGTDLELSLSVRSVATRNPLSCWSASCPSSAWSVRSLRTSRPTCASRAPPWWPFRRPAKLTWSVSLKTRTCAPSTPSESPSCPRTSSLHAGSAASEHKKLLITKPTAPLGATKSVKAMTKCAFHQRKYILRSVVNNQWKFWITLPTLNGARARVGSPHFPKRGLQAKWHFKAE